MLPDALFLNVHMYGIMIAVGVLCAFLVLLFYSKKLGIDTKLVDFVFYDGVAAIIGGFGFAALFQALYEYLENPEKGFKLSGNITFIGGLIGGAGIFLLAYFFYRRKLETKLVNILPVIPCCITVGHAFGRVGCFFAGCCYGKETDSFLGVKFPNLANKVYPTQLYEAVFLFILFGILTYLCMKKKFRFTLGLYMICYGVFRFFIEFLRGDDRGKLFELLSPSQFWSVLLVIGGIILWAIMKKRSEMVNGETNNTEQEIEL